MWKNDVEINNQVLNTKKTYSKPRGEQLSQQPATQLPRLNLKHENAHDVLTAQTIQHQDIKQ